MDIQQLKYFQVLAACQHVTRAAEMLSLSQPALSRSIAKLEEELGVPLFERYNRSIKLNRYGQMFLVRVERVMKELSEGKQELFEVTHPERGEISLGFIHTLGTNHIPNLIGEFRIGFPHIQFQLVQNHSYSLLNQLMNGELHMCLLAEPRDPEPSIEWTPLWKEEILAVVPSFHRLAKAASIKLDELANESFILLKKGYALRQTTDLMFQEHGIDPNITFEGEEVATVAGLVGSGLGVSLLPDLQGLDTNKVAQIRLKAPESHRTIGLAWMNERYLPPAAINFKNFIINKMHPIN
ncbi:LysR family transcriptional regulator [Paenibacillus sp. Aloe-11]|uniref:LysR family transcriptional regulator n=1 Tax=Paenibacillus sp. Aloe-11 TaxID=1050222 RepID=UPI00024F0862|nr:LysR family transcriptional regulator [Paenibacillus sp. Aloe-11]EHS59733.1 YybE [Paenibacillus sp. Aloe-11]